MDRNSGLDWDSMLEFIEILDAAAILDATGKYIYVSKSWEKFTGVSAEQALGHKVWEIIPSTHAEEVFRTGKPVTARVVRAQGVPAVTNYIPRLDADGKVIGVFIYVIIHGAADAKDLSERLALLAKENEFYKEELSNIRGARYSLDNIIGKSSAIQKLKEQILQASRFTSTVLIEGETGSGKELIAHAIHSMSPRKSANFVRVNCSAIPADLMESEFFGYSAGAFTGAAKKGKVGRFELANKGSIFLDEINLLTSTMQPKFLRVLQEREVDPVGGNRSVPVDVRVIAASGIPLETLVEKGEFRSDLYYRLNVIRIQAPPLRDRKEDIPLLVENFLARLNHQLGMMIEDISPSAMEMLMEYDWPGNVRELQNAVEQAMNLADGPILRVQDFCQLQARLRGRKHHALAQSMDYKLRPARQAFERDLIRDALRVAGGNRVKAAKLLGISRTVLYNKIEEYKLK